jgi:uncharacterized protein
MTHTARGPSWCRPGSAGLSRRSLAGLPLLGLFGLLAGATGCVSTADPTADRYHHGELSIASGNTTGVFYEIGAGYAALINQYLPGYEAITAPSNGSVENLRRLATGDVDLALVFSDNAVEALRGAGQFASHPLAIRALARLYRNFTHLVAHTSSGITSCAGLRGHRVATGPRNSGSETSALRALAAAGLTPGRDVTTVAMSLTQGTAAVVNGSVDAMFYSAGLPIPGITDLFGKAAGRIRLVPLAALVPELDRRYGAGVYTAATIPRATYGTPADVPTFAVGSLLVVIESMPADLVYDLTRLLFEHQPALVAVHPAAAEVRRADARVTYPVPLHPGAARYYDRG